LGKRKRERGREEERVSLRKFFYSRKGGMGRGENNSVKK